MKDIDCLAVELKIFNEAIEECDQKIEALQKELIIQRDKCNIIKDDLQNIIIFKENLENIVNERKTQLEASKSESERTLYLDELQNKQHMLDILMEKKFNLHKEQRIEDIKTVRIQQDIEKNIELKEMLIREKDRLYDVISQKELDNYQLSEEPKGIKK